MKMNDHLIQQKIDDHCHSSIVRIKSVRWFSRVGLPYSSEDYFKVKTYLETLGCLDIEVGFVTRLVDAEYYLQLKFDSSWQAVELERASQLHNLISKSCGNQGSQIFHRIFNAIFEPIVEQARSSISDKDSYLNRVAAGSVAETCYLYTLESFLLQRRNSEVNRTYTRKLEIFEQGRWPLCMKDGRFTVY